MPPTPKTAIQPYQGQNLVPGKPVSVPVATRVEGFSGIGRPAQAPTAPGANSTMVVSQPDDWMAGAQQGPRFTTPGEPPVMPAPSTNVSPWGGQRGMGSVIKDYPYGNYMPLGDTLVFQLAQAADNTPPWGVASRARDSWLRAFWRSEPMLAGAVTTMTMKYANMEWSLKGSKEETDIVAANLNSSERGAGWNRMMSKVVQDCLTQDNGGWMEVVRTEDSPIAPCVALNHLDSGAVWRTGSFEQPVLYMDNRGIWHRMMWYQVIEFVDMPSPIQAVRGLQLCAISRVLKMAQSIRDMIVFHQEKVSGQFQKAVHLVSGIQRQVIDDTLQEARNNATNMQLTRYIQPAIVASLDPNAKVSVATLPLADLPEGFDWDMYFKWYMTTIAMNFGGDYQDLAPLPTGNLGSSQGASFMLHMKSRGRGTENFTNTVEQAMNTRGIMPRDVVFSYSEQDSLQQMEKAELTKTRAQTRQIQIASGESSPELARLEAVAVGDMDQELLDQVPEADLPTEMPGAFPGGPMKNGQGGTTSPETSSSPDNRSPGGRNPKRVVSRDTKAILETVEAGFKANGASYDPEWSVRRILREIDTQGVVFEAQRPEKAPKGVYTVKSGKMEGSYV